MSFIGIVASLQSFKKIQQIIKNEIKDESISIIHINLRSIENIKNIKFETIIIEDNLKKFDNKKEIIKRICENAPYVIINTDINKKYLEIEKAQNKITYGLNQNADVTVSSITDSDVLVYWQKSLNNKIGEKVEIEERRIQRKWKKNLKIYEILILYTIFKLYNQNIIEKI